MLKLATTHLREKVPLADRAERWRRRNEDLHIANRDSERGHDIDVEIRDGDETAHRGRYRLVPDQSGSSVNLLPAGQYAVTATVDGSVRETATVRVSDRPDQTIYIEVADGSVEFPAGGPR